MMSQIKTITRFLNLISYLMIGISILLLLTFSYYPKYLLDFIFLQSNSQLIIVHRKDYHNLTSNDIIYYYQNGEIITNQVSDINIAKYQISLQNSTYITPTQYIGTKFYTLPFSISFTRINSLLFFLLLIPLSILFLILQSFYRKPVHTLSHE